jgi:hypothetical protein
METQTIVMAIGPALDDREDVEPTFTDLLRDNGPFTAWNEIRRYVADESSRWANRFMANYQISCAPEDAPPVDPWERPSWDVDTAFLCIV